MTAADTHLDWPTEPPDNSQPPHQPTAGGPPHDDQAEAAVLGAMLLSADTIDTITPTLTSNDFYRPHHAAIYATITAMWAAGTPVDPLTVAAQLADQGALARIGGANYLHTLIASVPTVANATWYARTVAGKAQARDAQIEAQHLLAAAQTGDPAAIADIRAKIGQNAARPSHRHEYTDGAAYVLDIPDHITSMWGHDSHVLWAPGEALMICGPAGVGKSTLAGQLLACRLGLTKTLLGYPTTPGDRRVLYIAADRPAQIARSLRRTLKPEWRHTLTERLTIWKGPPPADFAKQPALLRTMCEDAGADTVFIDSLKDVAIGLSDDEVGAAYNRARQLALAAGVEVVELHHQVKRGPNGAAPTQMADVYGSTWITAGAGSVLLLWGAAGDPVVQLTHLKQPAEEVGPLQVIHDHQAGLSTVLHQPDLVRLAASSPAGVTAPEAARLMFETTKPTAAQQEKARRKLENLVANGRLITGMGRAGGTGGSSPKTYHAAADEQEER